MNTLPANLPPLPKRAAYLGLGTKFNSGHQFFEGWALRKDDPADTWEYSLRWGGDSDLLHFAAPADSEVVKLNQKEEAPYPPLPEGHVYLGMGGKFSQLPDGESFLGYACRSGKQWEESGQWSGNSHDLHYCAPADSKVVKLNQPQPPADPKQFIIWCPQCGEPTKLQPSLEAATAEVKRLAAKHPSVTYHICEIVAAYVGEVTVKKI